MADSAAQPGTSYEIGKTGDIQVKDGTRECASEEVGTPSETCTDDRISDAADNNKCAEDAEHSTMLVQVRRHTYDRVREDDKYSEAVSGITMMIGDGVKDLASLKTLGSILGGHTSSDPKVLQHVLDNYMQDRTETDGHEGDQLTIQNIVKDTIRMVLRMKEEIALVQERNHNVEASLSKEFAVTKAELKGVQATLAFVQKPHQPTRPAQPAQLFQYPLLQPTMSHQATLMPHWHATRTTPAQWNELRKGFSARRAY